MVELKVRKFGNSLGVILPKEVLQRLTATEGDRLLLLESPDGTYRLTTPKIRMPIISRAVITGLRIKTSVKFMGPTPWRHT
jgi:antitoxin component of MazEF toxin-antitoxin module